MSKTDSWSVYSETDSEGSDDICAINDHYAVIDRREIQRRLGAFSAAVDFRAAIAEMIHDDDPHEMGGPFIDANWVLSHLDAALAAKEETNG